MILGISGKKRSGKDTVGKIIQDLTNIKLENNKDPLEVQTYYYKNTFQIKKFADKLKDIVCLLINCTREQLEDEVFKNTELGEEWNTWRIKNKSLNTTIVECVIKKECLSIYENIDKRFNEIVNDVKLTPRLLLQKIGTDLFRNQLLNNIWVNSLFSKYIPDIDSKATYLEYPNWIITDVRFPNEAEKIKEKGGVLIRIESPRCNYNDNHSSEIALDDYGGIGDEVRADRWDSVIFNDGTIEELIEKVKKVLIKHKIIENV